MGPEDSSPACSDFGFPFPSKFISSVTSKDSYRHHLPRWIMMVEDVIVGDSKAEAALQAICHKIYLACGQDAKYMVEKAKADGLFTLDG